MGEENKGLRASLELTQVKQEIERRIAQKEDEFAATRKNFGKAIEGMQMALEAESKGKAEALRMKKKLDTDVVDLGVALEHANAANAESQRNIKLIQDNIRNVQKRLERDKKLLEAQVKDAANRVDEAEQNALKGGKKAIAKMETRVRELESELDAESRRCNDAQKNLRKSERHIKELSY